MMRSRMQDLRALISHNLKSMGWFAILILLIAKKVCFHIYVISPEQSDAMRDKTHSVLTLLESICRVNIAGISL